MRDYDIPFIDDLSLMIHDNCSDTSVIQVKPDIDIKMMQIGGATHLQMCKI